MKRKRLKKACSFLLAGAMVFTVFPYSGNAVYAQEETEITQPAENEKMTEPAQSGETAIPEEQNDTSAMDMQAEEIGQQETEITQPAENEGTAEPAESEETAIPEEQDDTSAMDMQAEEIGQQETEEETEQDYSEKENVVQEPLQDMNNTEFNIADGSISIDNNTVTMNGVPTETEGSIILTGTSAENTIDVQGNVDLIFRDLNISTASKDRPIVNIASGNVNIELQGNNFLSNVGGEYACLRVSNNTDLTVSGQGSLTVRNGDDSKSNPAYGSGIGGNYQESPKSITINGGNISVTEYGTAAAIGGGAWADSGKISITDGTVSVQVYDGGDRATGTGIGGGAEGYEGSNHIGEGGSADISITGGTVTAVVKPDSTYESGAAIGSGQNKGGNIYIGGNAVVNAKTWVQSAAIGGGSGVSGSTDESVDPPQNDPGSIVIEGEAQVTAETVAVDIGEPYCSGAGIGAGGFNHQQWSITIKGNAKVNAKNGAYGAGIGGAYEFSNTQPVSVIITENAVVDASSDWFGAGIGTGYAQVSHDVSSTVTISGNASVKATGGKGGYNVDGGAGIGAGSDSWIASIILSDNAKVVATGGTGASAIGGATSTSKFGNIEIGNNVNIEAYADGTLFAVDTRYNVENIANSMLNARFATGANEANKEKKFYTELDGKQDKKLSLPANYRSFATTASISDNEHHEVYVKATDNDYAYYPEDSSKIIQYDIQNQKMLVKDDLNWIRKCSVNYKFESASDESLPKEITDMLPKSEIKDNGVKATPATLKAERVETTDGVWLFEGWSPKEVENLTEDITFVGIWKYYPYQAVKANDLTVYEGGLGSNDSTSTGDALPEPVWNEQISGHTVTVDGKEWNVEEQGLPFTWKYLDEKGKEVTSSARVGTYNLNVYPKEELKGKDIIIDSQFILKIPEDGLKVSTVKVREITNNKNADSLSTDIFKNVYNYVSPQASSISAFASDLDGSALDGKFNSTTGTHDDNCDPNEPHAHVKEGTTFLKNGISDMPVGENAKIGMLWDNLLSNVLGSEQRMQKLHEKSLQAVDKGTFNTDGTIHKEFKYVDLVDMTDGNVWVGTAQNDVTVYYPYPEGVTKDSAIAVTYYDGLTRDYTIDMGHADLDNEINKSNAHPVNNLRKTDTGILFDVPSKQFGPIEVMWQKSYTPAYEFISGTDSKELPQEVTDLLTGIEAKNYIEGIAISAPELTTKDVKVADGVWTFQKWDADSKVSADGVKFTGTWTFSPNAGVINTPPTISAKDKTLTVGDRFDDKKDVTASDKEDGDLTDKIEIIENTVDTSKAGTYTVTYKVTDKDGASTTKTIIVTVKDKDKEEQPAASTKPDKGDNNSNDKNNTASKPDKQDTPVKTGDSTNVLLWSMVAVISLAGVITVLIFKRRRSR